MKRALVLRHVEHEGIAGYREPIEAAGYAIERVAAHHAGCARLDTMSPDLLVVMGGPMGVYDTDRYPWLSEEIAVIRRRLAADLPTLGVCLGSQLIAAALGAEVRKGPVREIGFAPVALTDAGKAGPLRHLDGIDLLHWHGDTFDVPDGTELLATTAPTPKPSHAAITCSRSNSMPRWERMSGSSIGSPMTASISPKSVRRPMNYVSLMTGSVRLR